MSQTQIPRCDHGRPIAELCYLCFDDDMQAQRKRRRCRTPFEMAFDRAFQRLRRDLLAEFDRLLDDRPRRLIPLERP